jgi:RHS repeat-associated protein
VADAFGPAGQGRLYLQGSLVNVAALGTQVQLDFYGKQSPDPTTPQDSGTLLGSKTVTQTTAGSIAFTVNLKADVAPGTWVAAAVHGRSDGPAWGHAVQVPVNADPFHKGVPAALEALAPNNGDGNGDGIPDNQQADVVSVPVTTTGEFITLESPGHHLTDVQVFDPPARGETLPLGLVGFKVHDVTPGGSAIVRMILPHDVYANNYYKQDPVTGLLTPFTYDGKTGAEINANVITLHLQDGGRGDADGKVDGVISDPGGPGGGTIMIPCDNGISGGGWTVIQTGGSGANIGTVTYDGSGFVLTEGNSFQIGLSHSFTIPSSPNILTFNYSNLSFDTAGAGHINDAFEAAFVDSSGKSVVPTIAPGRNAFFNISRGQAPALAAGVTLQNGTVNVDISKLFAGTSATFIVRLVNNDPDIHTTVRISCHTPPAVTVALADDTAPTGPGTDQYRTDKLTTDPTITGTATDTAGIVKLQAQIDGGSWTDITSTLNGAQYTWYPGALAYGVHTIAVQATDTSGLSTTASLTFTMDVPPTANAGGPQTLPEGSATTFDGTLSSDPEAPLFSYLWTFPDGSTQTTPIANYTFVEDGTYNVTLTVTDIAGSKATDTSVVTVTDVPATIVTIPDQTINETGTASFLTSFTDPGLLDTHTASINWGDGTTSPGAVVEAHGAGTIAGSHVYPEEGIFHASVTLTDNGGATATANFIVTVNDVPPTLTISGASTVNAGQPYTLTLSATPGHPDPVTSWTITWGDGSTSTVADNNTAAMHVYSTLSKFTITATGTTDDGVLNANQVVVTVNNIPPTVAITGPTSTNEGSLYTLNLIGISNSGNPTLSWTINWGDNSTSQLNGNPGSATHTYADGPNTYTITATARDVVTTYNAGSLTLTVNNVGPTVTPSTDQTEIKNTAFTLQVATFTDPGFTSMPAGTQEAPFTATINWGDGSATATGTVAVTQGSPGVLTSGTVTGTYTYTAAGDYTVTVTVTDDEGAVGTGQFVIHVLAHGAVKFYVVDQSAHEIFRYDLAGNPAGATAVSHNNQRPWGITTDAAVDTLWIVDANKNVQIYVYNPDGSLRGSWIADVTKQPRDIATTGSDIFLVDSATNTVYRFANATGYLSGEYAPTSSFALDPANTSPSGMVTDGQTIWITDDKATTNNVFVYSMTGTKLGNWTLDPADITPSGITLNPNAWSTPQGSGNPPPAGKLPPPPQATTGGGGGTATSGDPATDLWTVDRSTSRAYRYAGGSAWRSGSYSATSSFALDPSDHHAEGIADPVVLSVQTPAAASNVPQGGPVLVSGAAQPSAGATLTSVAVNNGQTFVDPGGDFFQQLTAAPGQNPITAVASDSSNSTATQTLSVTGTAPVPPGQINFALLSDVTASIGVTYGRTSFNNGTSVLYADLTATNIGTYAIGTPFLVGVRHISAPSVRAYGAAGLLPDGTPYYNLSSLVSGGVLGKGQATQTGLLTFLDPEGLTFTYDLVFLGRLNHPPRWTSVPVLSVVAGQVYNYQGTAFDSDGDPLGYAVVAGPTALGFPNAGTGLATWATSTSDVGTYPIRLRVSDGKGGTADQTYILSVLSTGTNYPPYFTSVPVVDANVNTLYSYQATAADLDNDTHTFSVVSGPTGLIVNATTGLVTWTPSYTQLGAQTVTLKVTDAGNLSATQVYTILVQQQPGNLPPYIISTPVTSVPLGWTYTYPVRAIDADKDPLIYSLLAGAPTGMTIDPNLGNITWQPTATGSYPVTVRVDDGRGGYDTQTFTITVTTSSPLLGALYGTKYNDLNGDGVRDPINPGATTLNPINMTPVSIPDFPEAIAYDALANTILMAVTTGADAVTIGPNGQPLWGGTTKFEKVSATGAETLFATVTQDALLDGNNFAVVDPGNAAGFVPGDVFLPQTPGPGAPPPNQIIRITNGGATIQNPWATLTNATGAIRQLTVDSTGVFGGDLLALVGPGQIPPPGMTVPGQVWKIDGHGTATLLANNVAFNGDGWMVVVPNNTTQYGPLAGKLLITSDGVSAYTVDPSGAVVTLAASGLDNSEGLAIVPAASNFFAIENSYHIDVADGGQFAPIQGQFVVAHESGAISPTGEYFDRVWWNGTSLQTQQLVFAPGVVTQLPWEQVAFQPAPLGPVGPPREPGLPNWTIYLDLNHDGHLDPGDPYTVTDANGNYAFTNLQPGTYTVAEVQQTGWTQKAPTPVPPGTYTVTVAAGQAISGLDFGNQQNPPAQPPDTPPVFTTTPPNSPNPAVAVAGQLFRYNAAASDGDGDTLTFDLPVAPTGMAVDGPTGVVVWRPTAAQLGTFTVLLRVTDSRGSVALQSFQITVNAFDTPPVITSSPNTTGLSGFQYQYQVQAQDAENSPLTYSVTAPGATGLSIGTTTGLVLWSTPVVGTYTVTVQVSDGVGATTQTYTLTVVSTAPNQAPTITSTPPTQIQINQIYVYEVQAGDADGDSLTYSLTATPLGTTPPLTSNLPTINATTGVVSWTPTAGQLGSYTMAVTVSDGRNATYTQSYTLYVVNQESDQPPTITSMPPLVATVGQVYAYNAQGSDPNNNPLAWTLTTAPAGMSVNAALGTVRWTPTPDQVGSQNVTLRVVDSLGLSATQSFTIVVHGENLPPMITSTPVMQGQTGKLYNYAVVASDADGDPLSYSVTTSPSTSLSISGTGLISWASPTAGNYTVTVTVSDGQGGTATQIYTLSIVTAINYPPVITSQPVTTATTAAAYQYQVVATDKDGDTQTYSLSTIPTISTNPPTISAAGLVKWMNPVAGTYTFVVTDTDGGGLKAEQIYTLTVQQDTAPTISSTPPSSVTAGLPYRYDVQASDADNDTPLTYSLTGSSLPTWLSIDAATGRISGTPPVLNKAANSYTVSGLITVTDPFGSTGTQPLNFTVQPNTTPPTIELQISPSTTVAVGTQVTFLVFASDNVGVTSLTLNVGGTNLALDDKGQAVMTMNTAGNFTVTATASDAATNSTTAPLQTLVVNNPNGTPPTVQLGSNYPAADAVITAPTTLEATISDDHVGVSYTLLVIPFDGSPTQTISSGSTTTSNTLTFSTTFDPTLLANGDYTLELRTTDTDDNLTTVTDRHVSVQGHLKLGRETLTVTDLTIPVAGIPIKISRTYDSLNAGKSLDFGYGWQLSYGDAQLKVDLVPGTGQTWGDYPPFTDGTHVYVTMPGGEREGFTFQPWEEVQFFGIIDYWHPYFVPDAGVIDQLTVPDALMTKDGNQYYTIESSGLNTYNPADPTYGDQYTVTTLTGLGYQIAADTGKLTGMMARNGNSLAFSSTGVTSSTGKTVSFTRDPAGHIVAITDPRGNSFKYSYDVNGNLVSVTDRANDPPTNYTYDANHAHYLSTLVDPLGVQQLQVTYDTTGRLSAQTDAKGHSFNFAFNAGAATEAITDPSLPTGAQTATVAFTPRGDPQLTNDPTGAQTTVTYNSAQLAAKDQPDTVTESRRNPDGTTSTFLNKLAYDAKGETTQTIDPAGGTSLFTYGPDGLVATASDALGNTTTNTYDTNGNLLSTVSPAGVPTAFEYDAQNNESQQTKGTATTLYTYDTSQNLASTTSPTGVTTNFAYDANGNPTGSSFPWINPANSSDIHTVATAAVFDANDRQTSATDEYNKTSQTHYDLKGRVTQSIDTLGNPTGYVYDAADHVIQTTTPDGLVSDTVYDPEGRTSYTDDPHVPGQADVRGTHTSYDSMGRVTETDRLDALVISVTTTNGISTSQVTSPGTLLSSTKSTYNDLGQVVSSADTTGQTTLFQYDADGRQNGVTDALTETTLTAYDAAGRTISSTDASGHTTQYVYNGDRQPVKTIFADGSFTQTSYDSQGRQSTVTDQMGRTTQDQYDAQGRLIAVVQPAVFDPVTNATVNPTTQYGYDAYGDLTSIRDAKGRLTQFTFDQFGHQLTHTLPLGQTESWTFDAFGRTATHTDFKGQLTQYHYDALGRVDTKTFYAAGSSTAGETVAYQFDTLNRLSQVTDTVGSSTRTTQYGYDLDNRLTSVTTPEGTVNYAYDPATGRHTRTYTANSDVSYGYDQLGRVQTVTVTKQNGLTLGTALVTTYFYTHVGTIDHVTYPNGTETDYGYDLLNRVTSVTNKKGATLLSSYAYALEADGLRTGVTEQELEAGGTYSTVAKTWTYDALQRLTQEAVTVTGSPGYPSYTDQYVYDLVGNRLSKTHTAGGQTLVTTDTYNTNDQLTAESGTLNGVSNYQTTYTYDTNGSLISVARTGANAESDTYGFDLQNRLSSANISRTENGQSVTIATSYVYDDSGPRAQSVVTTTIGSGSPTTVTTQFLVDSLNPTSYYQVLEEHTNGSATPTTSYLLGLSVFGQTNASGQTSVLLPDVEGSTRLVTDPTGTITARFAYDAYGSLLGNAVGILTPPATRILFAGQQLDLTLLQYYLRARFYDPVSGRFTAMDPSLVTSRDPSQLMRYGYGAMNPVNNFDPSGKELTGLIVGLAIGVGTVYGGHAVATQYAGGWAGAVAGALVGGMSGLLIGLADAAFDTNLSAADWFLRGAFGFAIGFLTGALAGSRVGGPAVQYSLLAIFLAAGGTFTYFGVRDALAKDNPDLAAFRIVSFVAAVLTGARLATAQPRPNYGRLPTNARNWFIDRLSRWIIYEDVNGNLRVQFNVQYADPPANLGPSRGTPQTGALVRPNGRVLVVEGRHRLDAAQAGAIIPPADGGVPGLPGWLDYAYWIAPPTWP